MKVLAPAPQLSALRETLAQVRWQKVYGRVAQVVGLVVESNGPNGRLGDACLIETDQTQVYAEIVGFRGDRVLLMPLGDMTGIRAGCRVLGLDECLRIPVGRDLLGRVLDGIGQPIDELGELNCSETYPVHANPPSPLERAMISQPLATGVSAIDGLNTMGIGQRIGIFAGSGVGKSTLLGMIARSSSADVNVIALIGERGREVREFIQNDLQEEGLAKSVVICATSDEPALKRIKAAMSATAIAEYFRDQGLSVLLMMDSVTRFAMAQREVGLAASEPPSTRGYTPSVFALLPRLMERAGCGARGAITAIYTVLVEGDDNNEPVADAARSILDGHLVLSRRLTSRGHYPPIDVLSSLSRVMPFVTSPEHVRAANQFREMLAAHEEVEDLVNIGAYQGGAKPLADKAIDRWDRINGFLRQDRADARGIDATVATLQELVSDEV